MTTFEILTVGLSSVALVVAGLTYIRQASRDDETTKIQGRLTEIEETRHTWEREDRDREEEVRREAEEAAHSANFGIRYGGRDSSGSRGRVIAGNSGPEDARNVVLTLSSDVREVGLFEDTGTNRADLLRPDEGVFLDVVFTMGSAQPEDIRYRLEWTDSRGPHHDEGRLPLG